MTDTPSQTQPPTPPEIKGANWFSRFSVICGIIGFFTVGSAKTAGELLVTGVWGGVIGIVAIILGICGLRQFRTLRTGRGVAITGIVIGCVAGINIFQPMIDAAKHSRRDSLPANVQAETPLASKRLEDMTPLEVAQNPAAYGFEQGGSISTEPVNGSSLEPSRNDQWTKKTSDGKAYILTIHYDKEGKLVSAKWGGF